MQSTGFKVFRFDDVCANADLNLIQSITDIIFKEFENAKVIYGVSPLVHYGCGERVYPQIFNAYSDKRHFYKPDVADNSFLHKLDQRAELAGHGLVHIDHRLLTKEVQEISILVSCSLVRAKIFIPPFNKYNQDTKDICKENGIDLLRFETGWMSCEHNSYDPSQDKWYLHAREWTIEEFKTWLK